MPEGLSMADTSFLGEALEKHWGCVGAFEFIFVCVAAIIFY